MARAKVGGSAAEELERLLKRLKRSLKRLCRQEGIEDLSHLRYHTVALSEAVYRSPGGKTYRRYQLKAYYADGRRQRTKTVKSWREDDLPQSVKRIVALYRAVKHIQRALKSLNELPK
ncbi:MAG: hypothetical protein GXO03_04915 [Aquificae bacterium]|nr:hypothetical protein [Aquificota bacterium]